MGNVGQSGGFRQKQKRRTSLHAMTEAIAAKWCGASPKELAHLALLETAAEVILQAVTHSAILLF